MAIEHVETNTDASNTATSTISNHTVSGDNPVLVVKVATRETTPNQVTGITWNTNEDLVKLNSDINGNAGVEIWYLKAPTATTADIVISMSESNRCVSAASTYSGVDQNNPFRTAANNSNNGTNDAPTVDIIALDTEMVVDSLCQVSADPDTATAAHTERHNTAATGGGTDTRGASQEKASVGDTETMSWGMSDTDNWAICAGALQIPGPQTHGQTIIENISLSDEINIQGILTRSITETLTLGDSISISKVGQIHGQTITETLTLTDIFYLKICCGKVIQETLTLTDTINIQGVIGKTISETLTLTDTINLNLITGKSVSETLTLTDSILISLGAQTHGQTITETLTLADAINLNLIRGKFITETLTLTDTINIQGILTIGKSITENISLSDSILIERVPLTFGLSKSETLTLTDDLSIASYTPVELGLNINEILNLTDTINAEKYIEPKRRRRKKASMLMFGGRFRKTKIAKAFY